MLEPLPKGVGYVGPCDAGLEATPPGYVPPWKRGGLLAWTSVCVDVLRLGLRQRPEKPRATPAASPPPSRWGGTMDVNKSPTPEQTAAQAAALIRVLAAERAERYAAIAEEVAAALGCSVEDLPARVANLAATKPHYANLLRTMPGRYASHEAKEEEQQETSNG